MQSSPRHVTDVADGISMEPEYVRPDSDDYRKADAYIDNEYADKKCELCNDAPAHLDELMVLVLKHVTLNA